TQVRQMIDRVGPLDVSVLLVGETGTGKDVVAKALHDVSPRKGEPFIANNGTLFLDEIGDMPLALQAKLLRFLQERKLERVGGRDSISVNVRLICATNQKLEKLIAEQRFRE